jgi:hypothetical protein
MDNSTQNTQARMGHREAWAHFYGIWKGLPVRKRKVLPAQMRARIGLAQQDWAGKRKNAKGDVLRLGPRRVADILLAVSQAMPEWFKYVYTSEAWFESRK